MKVQGNKKRPGILQNTGPLYTVQMARAKEILIVAKSAKTGSQRWVDIQREVYRHILFIQGEGLKIVKPRPGWRKGSGLHRSQPMISPSQAGGSILGTK
jgi:hypothetical protein